MESQKEAHLVQRLGLNRGLKGFKKRKSSGGQRGRTAKTLDKKANPKKRENPSLSPWG